MTAKPRPSVKRRPAERNYDRAFATQRMRARLIAAMDQAKIGEVSVEDALVRQLIERALGGDLGAIRTIFQTIDRPPPKALQSLFPPEEPDTIRIVMTDGKR